MKRSMCAVLAIVLVCASALAAEIRMRSGRWETTFEIKIPGPIPAGMPGSAPVKTIECVTQPAAVEKQLVESLNDDSCKVENYRDEGNSLKFTVNCVEGAFDYVLTHHSEDFYTATGASHGKNPSERITFKYSAKRTGPACSAKELAQSRVDND